MGVGILVIIAWEICNLQYAFVNIDEMTTEVVTRLHRFLNGYMELFKFLAGSQWTQRRVFCHVLTFFFATMKWPDIIIFQGNCYIAKKLRDRLEDPGLSLFYVPTIGALLAVVDFLLWGLEALSIHLAWLCCSLPPSLWADCGVVCSPLSSLGWFWEFPPVE